MQSVNQNFHDAAQGSIVPIDWKFRVSFDKEFDNDVSFFTLNNSILNGTDVLGPSDDNPLQQWDKYAYQDYGDRVIALEWSRSIDFPYSVQSAIADVIVDNYDDYFTPNSNSPIASDILPARPIRIFGGYKNASTVQQFVGITHDMPEIDDTSKTASFTAMDFLSEMYTLDITDTIAMQNVTTDVVLSSIFQQFGLATSQYSLSKGRNKIPFLFFEKGTNAGNIFQKLMQSEMGQLWLDEQGIIRFDQRLKAIQTPVMNFDEHNIISIKVLDKDNIINTVQITSNVREVQNYQPIFSTARQNGDNYIADPNTDTTSFIIPGNSTAFHPDTTLTDPALSATKPTIGQKTDSSWFTAIRTDGTPVESGVSVTLFTLRQASTTLLFSNTNSFDVIVDQIEVWGEPAKIVDTINYKAYDEDSVLKYGPRLLDGQTITNDFFGNISNCDSFADYVIDAYKEYGGVIEMEVKGDLSLDLGDIINVNKNPYNSDYKVTSIANSMAHNAVTQTIQAERYIQREWFVLNQSILNGTSVLAP